MLINYCCNQAELSITLNLKPVNAHPLQNGRFTLFILTLDCRYRLARWGTVVGGVGRLIYANLVPGLMPSVAMQTPM
jgi:hypothetical protein